MVILSIIFDKFLHFFTIYDIFLSIQLLTKLADYNAFC